MNDPFELKCYTFPGWRPNIQPAGKRRDWMDNSPEAFAYRCLPLAMANAHGWEILSPCGFEAEWNGGPLADDVTIRLDKDADKVRAPVALFGQGTITFHVEGIFRTPPDWNIWIGGSPNSAKDGIAPLGALVETDWSPYSFTMNWRFTRPDHVIRFEANEPFCFFFPVPRKQLESVEPIILDIDEEPGLRQEFEAWSKSRDAFQAAVAANHPEKPADRWQKLYYRGEMPSGAMGCPHHQTKVRVKPFSK